MRITLILLVAFLIGGSSTGPSTWAEDVLITELMAINDSELFDEDGDASDWIEVFNAGDAPVNLSGWSLSDDPDALDKWQFPDVGLAAGRFLLVFVSGKNRTVAGGELHTNFRLGGDGEFLGLTAPGGTTAASAFSPQFPRQVFYASYGLGPYRPPGH